MNQTTKTILRLPQVISRTGLSKTTIYELSKNIDNPFPTPIKLSERASGWLAHEIDAWIDERMAQREGV